MRNSDHKIDEVFKNRLGDYEVTPPPAVWDRISDSMGYQRRKRRMLLIWTMSGAASLAFAFLMGWLLANRSFNNEPSYAELSNKQTNVKKQVILSSPVEQIINIHFDKPQFSQLYASANHAERSIISGEEQTRTVVNLHLMSPVEPMPLFYNAGNSGLAELKQNELSDGDRAIIDANLLAMNTDKNDKEQAGRWAIGMQASPVSSFDKIALISNNKDMAFANDALAYNTVQTDVKTDYATTVSGGFSISYDTGKRLTFVTGLGFNEVAQYAGDVAISYAGQNWLNEGYDFAVVEAGNTLPAGISSNNVILNTNLGLANVALPDGVALASVKTYSVTSESNQNYNFEQSAGYIEVPLLMHYQLIDKRFGLHLIGGVNTNILVRNNVSLANQNQVIAQSTTEGLRPVVFSSSVGMGLNYGLSERFSLNFEPTLKIKLNSLNTQSGYDAKPYTFGIFSGITYQF